MRHDWIRCTIKVLAILIIVLFALVVGAELLIGLGVGSYCQTDQMQFPGRRVDALTAMAACESCGLRDGNRAVRDLGRLDDSAALPVLEKYYTGAGRDHSK